MEEFNIWCANNDCDLPYVYKCETENLNNIDDGSEHSAVCPECGKTTLFEMSLYSEIVLVNERLAVDLAT